MYLKTHLKGYYSFPFSESIFHCWLEINVAQSFKKGMRFGIKYIHLRAEQRHEFVQV